MPVLQTVEDPDFIQNFFTPVFLDGFYGDVIDRLFLSALFTNSNYEFKIKYRQKRIRECNENGVKGTFKEYLDGVWIFGSSKLVFLAATP